MRLLILYSVLSPKERLTVFDHIYSFKRYQKEHTCFYYNVTGPLPRYLCSLPFDGILFHYSLLSYHWSDTLWAKISTWLQGIKGSGGVRVALPQDEYVHSVNLSTFFKEFSIETVFSCATAPDYYTLYPPEQSGLKHYKTVLTGYVDERTLKRIEQLREQGIVRDIDVGYRARDLPYWLGRHAQLKKRIEEELQPYSQDPSWVVDASTDPKDVFYGDDWLRFLLRCRTSPACLGGASLHDPRGEVRDKVDRYVEAHPQATFEEVEEACFAGQDGSLSLFALSPRHFECVMTRTCLLLVEGDYLGIFEGGRNCLMIRKDFSNLHQVMEQVRDVELCAALAEQAYLDVVASQQYTYGRFVEEVLSHLSSEAEGRVSSPSPFYAPLVQLWMEGVERCLPFRIFCFRVRSFLAHRWSKLCQVVQKRELTTKIPPPQRQAPPRSSR